MGFESHFNHGLTLAKRLIGEEVEYKPQALSAFLVTGIVSYFEKTEENSQNAKQTAKIIIAKSDVPNPQYQDEITIKGVVWKVEFVRQSGQYWELDLRSKPKQKF